jgi:MATE family multidrug resistance protein
MTIKEHIRANASLALPVMLSNLGHVLMGVTDTIMVGRLGATSLAAVGLALVIFNVFMLFGIGVSNAITPLVAEAHGERNPRKIVNIVRHGFVINVVTAIILILIVSVGRNMLYKIGQPLEVVERSWPFLSIVMFSLLPIQIFQTCKQFAEGMSNTRVALVVMIFTNVLNVILNYVFIYGFMAFPALGLEGAAWATLASRIFMAIAIVFYLYNLSSFKMYRGIVKLGDYSKSIFKKMLGIGIPGGIQFILEVAAFDFSLVMMGWLGTTALAAHQIAINLASLTYMTSAGLGAAATVRVGFFLGKRDYHNLRTSTYTMLYMVLVLMGVCAVMFMLLRTVLPTFYVTEVEVIQLASSLLIIAGLFQLSDGVQVVCASALRGFQDVKIPSIFIFISYWVIGLPMGYCLSVPWGVGPMGIWLGLLIGLTFVAVAMYLRLQWKIQVLTKN